MIKSPGFNGPLGECVTSSTLSNAIFIFFGRPTIPWHPTAQPLPLKKPSQSCPHLLCQSLVLPPLLASLLLRLVCGSVSCSMYLRLAFSAFSPPWAAVSVAGTRYSARRGSAYVWVPSQSPACVVAGQVGLGNLESYVLPGSADECHWLPEREAAYTSDGN